jgi:hypothetical protein
MEVVALIKRLVAKMSDRFLEQRINIEFCAKLGKNASHTYAWLSKAYMGDAPASLSPEKEHQFPLDRRPNRPQSQYGRGGGKKSQPLPGIEPRSFGS